RLLPILQKLRCFRRDHIADADSAAGGHLGIDTAFVVAEATHHRGRDVEVARCGFRVDVDGGAAADPLHDFQPRVANGEGLAEQLEFVPCRPAADVEIGAEPERMNRQPNDGSDGGDAAEIDDGNDFPGDIGKLWPPAEIAFGWPLESAAKLVAEDGL